MLVFVYGTLMRGFGNNPRLTGATFVGPATTVGRFKMRDVGFPYIKNVKRQGWRVRGEVYDIGNPKTDDKAAGILNGLDRLEGFDPRPNARSNHYTRMEFLVKVDDEAEARKVHLYHPTETTWERAVYAVAVPPDENGIIDWGKLHARSRER